MTAAENLIIFAVSAMWAVVIGFYFAWQRRRYLAGKIAWFPALAFFPLMWLTGHRPEHPGSPKAKHLFDHLVIHADAPTPMAYRAYLRNGKRIRAFLTLADECLARAKRRDNRIAILPVRPGGDPGVTGVGRER
jgi:hypothetical protein